MRMYIIKWSMHSTQEMVKKDDKERWTENHRKKRNPDPEKCEPEQKPKQEQEPKTTEEWIEQQQWVDCQDWKQNVKLPPPKTFGRSKQKATSYVAHKQVHKLK